MVGKFYVAVMSVNNLFTNTQTNAAAILFGGVVGQKRFLHDFLWHSRPKVPQFDFDSVVRARDY